ncbi:nuclear receptor coactivator 5 isoform X2 [Alosa sapidissima]|uniref:nuclear receptor coactivator 5 isoform X2 n=1 Tax=Alosa sapidissima TaxID=34773 RepID=UPI001C08AF6F|nr:nuclear receptor coactivator 5 isoform X2 [Alosa sapidissima]
MASWAKVAGGRRPPPSPNGGKVGAVPRSYRRAPYPLREDRGEEPKEREGFEPRYDEVNQEADYSADPDYEGYEQHAQSAPSPKRYHPGEKRHALYRWFYKVLEGGSGKRSADCVVLAVNTQNPDYAKSLGQSLQERGLSVEMICLQAESGLTRALQDIRSDGSPLCILVEQTNVTLSSCTVIIFSESLKIHRNMPRDHALDFVMVEYGRVRDGKPVRDPGELAVRAAELADDYLARDKLERHAVPAATRHLLLLLAEGVHLYPEELDTLSHFLHSRQEHLQAAAQEADGAAPSRNSLPTGMGSPPPLLPTPTIAGPPGRDRPGPPSPFRYGGASPRFHHVFARNVPQKQAASPPVHGQCSSAPPPASWSSRSPGLPTPTHGPPRPTPPQRSPHESRAPAPERARTSRPSRPTALPHHSPPARRRSPALPRAPSSTRPHASTLRICPTFHCPLPPVLTSNGLLLRTL